MTTLPAEDATTRSELPDHDGHAGGRSNGHRSPLQTPNPNGVDLVTVLAEVTNLRAQLETLPVIEQAKGILMGRYQIGADAAFALLRRWSSHTNVKLREISRLLVEAAGQPSARSSPVDGGGPAPSGLDRLIATLTAGSLPRHVTGAPSGSVDER